MRVSKMTQMVGCRLRVTLVDGRVLIGQMLAYDKHMNLVLSECEEFRLTRKGATSSGAESVRRMLGMLVLRGEEIVSATVESGAPPRGGNRPRIPAIQQQTGIATGGTGPRPPMMAPPGGPPVGLAGPVPGMFMRPGMMMPPPQ